MDVSEAVQIFFFVQIGGVSSVFLDSAHWCVLFSLTGFVHLQSFGDNRLICLSMEGFLALGSGQDKRT